VENTPSLDSCPKVPWVDEHVIVDHSSISGRGLFANTPLDAGRIVIRLGGRLVATAELERLIRESAAYVDTLTVVEDTHLVLPPGTMVHFGNHSCDPNLWHVGSYEIATRRRVEVGEELTIDYATNTGAPNFSMRCSCGALGCRRVIRSDDWRLPELQNAYAGHWVPALEERIRRLRGP
jgi:SET domain-containing protein